MHPKTSAESAVPERDLSAARREMVKHQIAGRGVRSRKVLKAMETVPRETFVPEHLVEFAYEDTPLPIEAEQTISQPYIVAFMIEALALEGGERVLEIGTGSGYAAALLGEIAGEVYTVERIELLANLAAHRLKETGYDNVHVIHADGTKGWEPGAPYDAIVVAAGGPDVPAALQQQLAVGGRLVIPVGPTPRLQELVRVTRADEENYRREDLADVRFVPLIGEEGWSDEEQRGRPPRRAETATLAGRIGTSAEPFADIDSAGLSAMLDRIGDARLVLLGESTHGTSEFYRMRARITRELIEQKGFDMVAVEADWPDAARIDHYVRHMEYPPSEWKAFARFPTWMWRNTDVADFVQWLHLHNADIDRPDRRVAFYGLDLYSLHTSIRAVLEYLERIDPDAARIARKRYGCLSPWEGDPATYGHAALTGQYHNCAGQVAVMLKDLLAKRGEYSLHDGERFLDAVQNARLVRNAERYYRTMYYGARASWNLRDQHMFDSLQTQLEFHGPKSKAVVWAHNSHVGNARATEMGARGEHNIGQLCRDAFGDGAYLVGFGTDRGTVAAAWEWDGPMRVREVQPAHPRSYERQCRDTDIEAFLLPLRGSQNAALRKALEEPRLQRAIGVIYRPETEIASHYFHAVLPEQFDEYVWFDVTNAVEPLETEELDGMPDTYPFGL